MRVQALGFTWTQKVCRIIALFVGFGPLFYLLLGGGLGTDYLGLSHLVPLVGRGLPAPHELQELVQATGPRVQG